MSFPLLRAFIASSQQPTQEGAPPLALHGRRSDAPDGKVFVSLGLALPLRYRFGLQKPAG